MSVTLAKSMARQSGSGFARVGGGFLQQPRHADQVERAPAIEDLAHHG